MRRLFAITTSVLILLALFAPAALAAGPDGRYDSVLVAVNNDLDVAAGQQVDTVVVVSGNATIAGTVGTVVVVDGAATFTGATIGTLVVADGTADLGAGTTVTGEVRTLRGTVTQGAGAVVQGTVEALDRDLAAFLATVAIVMIPVLIVLAIGFALISLVAALAVAAFGSRQVREVEALIEQRPGHVLLAGIAGTILLPLLSFLLVITVIGAPIGFTLAFVVLPALAFLGWLVAAIWVGDWMIGKSRGVRETGRPYRAAILGVIVLGIAGILPFVSGIATLFGFGGLLLAGWRMLRPETPPMASVAWPTAPAPSAG
ncbi:MAG TPA: hypothetical protein VES19_01015 [Candidatus Limnocylindrales bacterium]|nr:hypothetical protein [Candidatus Limnocylindrales bacterium]